MFKYFMKKKYPDWEDNEYNNGALKFIWGKRVLGRDNASFQTYNDIAIYYNRKTKKYILDPRFKTPYVNIYYGYGINYFKETSRYLVETLEEFTAFMNDNGYDTNEPYSNFAYAPEILTEADSIEELYTMFRIFVEGYKAVYGGDSDA